jgi:hypothetical protein
MAGCFDRLVMRRNCGCGTLRSVEADAEPVTGNTPARLIAGAWHADCRAAAGMPSGKIMPPPRENGTP